MPIGMIVLILLALVALLGALGLLQGPLASFLAYGLWAGGLIAAGLLHWRRWRPRRTPQGPPTPPSTIQRIHAVLTENDPPPQPNPMRAITAGALAWLALAVVYWSLRPALAQAYPALAEGMDMGLAFLTLGGILAALVWRSRFRP